MVLTRRCGHREDVPTPEDKDGFSRECRLRCRECRGKSPGTTAGKAAGIRDWLPRPMAMARDMYRE